MLQGPASQSSLHGKVEPNPMAMLALALPVFMGLIVGNLFYANLTYVTWRALLLVPLLALLLRKQVTRNKVSSV